jgi:SAM-dependent methyltransferase
MAAPTDAGKVKHPPIVWEHVPCPLCKAHAGDLLLSAAGDPPGTVYRLVRCRFCGLGYVNPRPDASSIGQFYPDDYEWYQQRPESSPGWLGRLRRRLEGHVLSTYFGYPGSPSNKQRALAALLYPWLAPPRDSHTCIPYTGRGRLLDYGCGAGGFARKMQQRGWDVVGMDFSAHAARRVNAAYGIPVHVGTLPHPAVAPESFDVINMGAVLEHVHRPHELVEAATRALRPGGLLVVAVPNIDSWTVRRFGAWNQIIDLPRHLLHFNPATLRRLLQAHGLEVEELRMLKRVGWLRRTFKMNVRRPDATAGQRWLARLGQLRPVQSLLVRWMVWTQQADCLFAVARRPTRPARFRVSA